MNWHNFRVKCINWGFAWVGASTAAGIIAVLAGYFLFHKLVNPWPFAISSLAGLTVEITAIIWDVSSGRAKL